MCAKQFHLGGRDADAVLGSQGMYVGGRTLVKGLQWIHLFLWNPGTTTPSIGNFVGTLYNLLKIINTRLSCGAESSYDVYLPPNS